jgi:hypothetical protein
MKAASIVKSASILLVALAVLLHTSSQASSSQDHTEWVRASMLEMQALKAGMTRSDVEKVFVAEGGISSAIQTTYTFRKCPYFHVDVEFTVEGSRVVGGAKDRFVKTSKPYLDWPRGD